MAALSKPAHLRIHCESICLSQSDDDPGNNENDAKAEPPRNLLSQKSRSQQYSHHKTQFVDRSNLTDRPSLQCLKVAEPRAASRNRGATQKPPSFLIDLGEVKLPAKCGHAH